MLDLRRYNFYFFGCWFVWSNLAFNFLKSWAETMFLLDRDIVEKHNISNQLYKVNQIWLPKANALKDNLMEYNINSDIICNSWIDLNVKSPSILTRTNNIFLLNVDSFETRINILKNLKDYDWLFIDTRTNSDVVLISFFYKDEINEKIEELEKLKNENKKDTWLCWEKSAFYLWSIISWLVLNNISNIQTKNKVNKNIVFVRKNNIVHFE
jgi:hypothetical protein